VLPLLTLAAIAVAAAPQRVEDSVAVYMGPGVSRELAAYRAARIKDVRYDLTLDVTRPDTAVGQVAVAFTRTGRGDLVLDFRGLALDAAQVNGAAAPGVQFNGAHVRIPAALLRRGANRVDLDFRSAIAPSGASIIRVRDVTDGATYLYTLLVPADANQLFPCFDQPDLKARVTLTLRTPVGWSAVANGAALSVDTSGQTNVHRFRETEPISTYLIAFAAGPWAAVSAAPRGRPMTMYVRPSRAGEAEVDSLLALNAVALEWLERYFGRPYPFGKYDFVLAPAFPFSGMEHPGAVFYSEESFIYRERPTLMQRLGRHATIYHEVAHQWFGDLVTMRWFDDLWLKEGFATYMASKMQDALDPAANAWKTFYLRNKPAAYGVDVTEGTTPVWQALPNLDQAKSNYGPIVYNKAPSVLKQLNYLVGDSAFRAGVRAFLTTHAYGNATWQDLLTAIGRASGRRLDAWGAQYILRPGMPVLEQRLALTDDGRVSGLTLVQRPARELPGRGPWPMRVEVLLGYEGARPIRIPVELRAETTSVAAAVGRPAPDFVYANSGDYGYALVRLDARTVEWLERGVGRVDDAFLRAMLWGSLWDMVRDARLDPARYLRLAMRELPAEQDEQIVSSILTRVSRAAHAYLAPGARDSLVPALETVLARVADDTTRPYGIRKAHLDALISIGETPGALARLEAILDGSTAAGAPLRPPTRWAIVTKLIERAVPSAERRLLEESRRDSTSEGRRRAFVAGAARPTAESKAQYFARYFGDRDLNEDWATASLRAFNAPSHSALTLPFVRPALDSLRWIQRNRRIFYLGSWLDAFLSGQTSPEALAQVEAFLVETPRLPRDLRQKVLQAVDELQRTVAIRGGRAARSSP
jgi:aminopeptidase N